VPAAFEDLTTAGRTDLGPAMQEAVRRSPDAIVIATAKGFNLDDTVVEQAEKARAGKPVKVHTIDLTGDATGRAVLEAIANKAGGTYHHVPPNQLGGE
jgi:Mg-chelatase subunit ChlD